MALPKPVSLASDTGLASPQHRLPWHTLGAQKRQQGLLGWRRIGQGSPPPASSGAWSLRQVHCMLSWGWAETGKSSQGAESQRDAGPSQQPCTNEGPHKQSQLWKGSVRPATLCAVPTVMAWCREGSTFPWPSVSTLLPHITSSIQLNIMRCTEKKM